MTDLKVDFADSLIKQDHITQLVSLIMFYSV